MRKTYEAALKKCMHDKILNERMSLHITQEKMAELLIMDLRSYVDIENGKNMCGTLTFVMYLLHFCDDPKELMDEIEKVFLMAEGETDAEE